jgi:hypothetical protein
MNVLARHMSGRGALGMVEDRRVELDPETRRIQTHRLVLRPWRLDDRMVAALAGCRCSGVS